MKTPAKTVTHAIVGGVAQIEVADVAMDARTAGNEALYTYSNAVGASPGDTVVVPLGPRTALGTVLSIRRVSPRQLGFAPSALRQITGIVHGVRLPETLLDLVEWVATETLSSTSAALGLAMPPGLKERIVTEWKVIRALEKDEQTGLSVAQSETLKVLADHGGSLIETKQKPIAAGAKKHLRSLRKLGIVEEQLSVAPLVDRHRLTGEIRLTSDEHKIELFLAKNGKKRPAQALTLMRLQGASTSSFSAQEVKALSGATDQTLHALIQAGLLERVDADGYLSTPAPVLNPAQRKATDAVVSAITGRRHESFLLFGVTGSGKTEVYLHAAEQALRLGRSVLYLVPEIALTAQVIAQLRNRFGRGVTVLHSNLPPQERLANWLKIASGEAAVILGARSALFSPIRDLGLVIVDEEHENSYKQESAPRYHGRDVALFLGQQFDAPVVLGSATPSIESFYAAETEKHTLLEMPVRTASAKLPTIHIQDLTELYRERHPSLFSPLLKQKMVSSLAREEQVILFLNRRAYSPFLLCRDCGHQFKCVNCATAMSFHKRVKRLKCHHCAREEAAPDVCPACSSDRIGAFGTGAEKVEEAVRQEFPTTSVARLDRDIAAKSGALEETLALFRSRAIQVLVGTQMVAKGLDFPHVTLVGVIAADISLNIPDFRASERTFQLLSQVSGRAGRGERPGEVVIQTLAPENHAIRCAMSHDYRELYRNILSERKEAWYPPFCRLINIVISGEDREAVGAAISDLSTQLKSAAHGVRVNGPVDCPLERLNNQWRMHLLLKLPLHVHPSEIGLILAGFDPKKASMMVDVNPHSMM